MKKILSIILFGIAIQSQLICQTKVKTDFGEFKIDKKFSVVKSSKKEYILKDSLITDSLKILKKIIIKEITKYDKLPTSISNFSIYDYPSEKEENLPNKENYFEGITSIYNMDLYYFNARKIFFKKGSYRNINNIINEFEYYFLHKKKLYLISQSTNFYPKENIQINQYKIRKLVTLESNNIILNEIIRKMKLK